ncbi:MAG TPA: hypothetical protein VEC93_09560 [Anaerolineae bacterium]|nr:hypothetical protein [Anaerolineae bacterium]
MQQDKVSRLSDAGKNVWDEDSGGTKTPVPNVKKASFGQRWNQARPTKMIVFWSLIAVMVLTMIVGFNWGGWVTGGTAQKMAEVTARNAVAQRLTPMCVDQFNQDPGKEQKLTELKDMSVYKRGAYVEKQGWATMSGEAKPDRQVANECAKLLISQ